MKMNITKSVYCRLCAELKPQNELTDMQTDEETCQKVINKLSRFNISMDFQENTLPKTVCLPCVTSLEKAFTFVTAVEQAQAFLSTLILVKSNSLKHDVCDDVTFFAQTEGAREMIDIKIENRRDPMDVDNDQTNFGEECNDDDVFNDNGNNISSEEVNMDNKVSAGYCYVTIEKMNIKDETDVDNIEENESLNFSSECKYRENELNIKDNEELSAFKENLTKRIETKHNCEKIPPSEHKVRRNKKKCKGPKNKHKQPILNTVPKEQDSTVYSEDYMNKQINRLSVVPIQYLKLTWMDYEWKCSHCGTLFANIEELQKHSLQYHNVCNAYQCIDCKTKKQRLNAFIKHVRSHRKHLHYSCYKCFEKFPKMMDTRQHKTKIHENSKYLCLGCNTPFGNNAELEEHVNKFYNILWRKKDTSIDDSDNLTCDTCHLAFANKTALRKHLMRHKPNKRDHVCDRCGKCFDSQPTLRCHMDTHSERLLYSCEICKTTFNSIYSLRYHASIHSGVKPFTCDICSKCFRTKSQITNHMKFHSDYFPFPCTVCSKKFRTDCNLKNHMRQHTGAKPFSCDICQRDFTNLSNRNKHMRRRHGIEMAKKRQPIIKQPDDMTSSDQATEEIKFTDLDKINEWKYKTIDHRKTQKVNSKIRKVKVISKEWNEN